jgi:hypothetical protein
MDDPVNSTVNNPVDNDVDSEPPLDRQAKLELWRESRRKQEAWLDDGWNRLVDMLPRIMKCTRKPCRRLKRCCPRKEDVLSPCMTIIEMRCELELRRRGRRWPWDSSPAGLVAFEEHGLEMQRRLREAEILVYGPGEPPAIA